MLKSRNFILALCLTPLLSLAWQMPSQAGSNSPSKGTAGSLSGGGTNGSGGTIFSVPPIILRPRIPISPNIKVLRNGLLIIPLEIQGRLNTVAINIVNLGRQNRSIIVLILEGLPGRENNNLQAISIRFINLGAPPNRVQSLTKALLGLCRSRRQASVPGIPVAELQKGQLVASIKAMKANFTLAQEGGSQPSDNVTPSPDIQPDLDINQLNDAVEAYNQIVSESSPVTLQKLLQDQDFVEIGKVLKELRAAIN
jgi:hypothetical protein